MVRQTNAMGNVSVSRLRGLSEEGRSLITAGIHSNSAHLVSFLQERSERQR